MGKVRVLLEHIEHLGEMANIGPKTHKFGVNVKLNILQPTKSIPHAERVKVFRKNLDLGFTVTLNQDPKKMRVLGKSSFLSAKEFKKVVDGIIRYRKAFIKFWNDPNMTTDELIELMKEIDNNGDV